MDTRTLLPFERMNFPFSGSVVLLDVDGTLMPDGEEYLSPDVAHAILQLAQRNSVYLCTNGRDEARNVRISRMAGVPLAPREGKKPSRRAVGNLPTDGRPLVVIGDKWSVDFVFAKRIGAAFVPVQRKVSGRERLTVKAMYSLDACIAPMLRIVA